MPTTCTAFATMAGTTTAPPAGFRCSSLTRTPGHFGALPVDCCAGALRDDGLPSGRHIPSGSRISSGCAGKHTRAARMASRLACPEGACCLVPSPACADFGIAAACTAAGHSLALPFPNTKCHIVASTLGSASEMMAACRRGCQARRCRRVNAARRDLTSFSLAGLARSRGRSSSPMSLRSSAAGPVVWRHRRRHPASSSSY